MARRLKLKPLPEPAKLPTGVRKTFHAHCAPCGWNGPHREDATQAGWDYTEHKKTAEAHLFPCSKEMARIQAQDKRKGITWE